MDLGIKINKMMLFGLGRELWMEKAPKVEIFQDCKELAPWEKLLKQLLWRQIGDVRGKRILDYGSGLGVTANHYARYNQVVAIEPAKERVLERVQVQEYQQLEGGLEVLKQLPDDYFDVVFCHNVLEYVSDAESIVREFHRLLKPDGMISVVKHNRAGRVMQMVVLLNEFEKADALLNGEDGCASAYGTIHYYEDADVTKWCKGFQIKETFGIRTFWDLQQKQECHKDPAWQEKMIEAELRVSQILPYRDIAFFHHLILEKE